MRAYLELQLQQRVRQGALRVTALRGVIQRERLQTRKLDGGRGGLVCVGCGEGCGLVGWWGGCAEWERVVGG